MIRRRALVLAIVSVWVLSFVLTAGIIMAHAFRLALIARGAPDPNQIQQFADTAGPLWGSRLGILATAIAAIWLGRRTAPASVTHGVLLGLIVGGVPLVAAMNFSGRSIAVFAATLLAGAIVGWLASLRMSARDRYGKA